MFSLYYNLLLHVIVLFKIPCEIICLNNAFLLKNNKIYFDKIQKNKHMLLRILTLCSLYSLPPAQLQCTYGLCPLVNFGVPMFLQPPNFFGGSSILFNSFVTLHPIKIFFLTNKFE